MNKIYLYLSLMCFILTGTILSSCSSDENIGNSEALTIKVFSPTKVIPGQEVIITGTGLDKVKTVSFPGDIDVTDIEVTSAEMIRAVTPIGIDKNGGKLVIKSENEIVSARIPMTVGNPSISTLSPSNEISAGNELQFIGNDLEFITKVILPGKDGNIEINAIDFVRKSTSQIKVNIPSGIKEGHASIRLIDASGKVYDMPKIVLKDAAGQWVTKEITAWTGEHSLGVWDNNMYIKPEWFEGIELGSTITIHFAQQKDDSMLKFNLGDWGKPVLPELASQSDKQLVNTAFLGSKDATSFSFILNESMFSPYFQTGASDGNALIINGDGMIIKKITYTKQVWVENGGDQKPKETTLWEGSTTIGEWSGSMSELAYGAFDWTTINSGQIIKLYFTENTSSGWWQIRLGDGSWNAIPSCGDKYELDEGATNLEVELTEADLKKIIDGNGLVICGAFFTITKVTIR